MHQPFDGAFPAHYTAETALAQCRQVFIELLDHPEGNARDRAYTMLHLAQSGLHAFDREAGQELYDAMDNVGLDDDAKRTVVLKLHAILMPSNICCKYTPSSTVSGTCHPLRLSSEAAAATATGLAPPAAPDPSEGPEGQTLNSATALTPHQCRLKCGSKAPPNRPGTTASRGCFRQRRYNPSMWVLIFETPWLLGAPPIVWGTAALFCLGVIYLIYLAANMLRIARAVRKKHRQQK